MALPTPDGGDTNTEEEEEDSPPSGETSTESTNTGGYVPGPGSGDVEPTDPQEDDGDRGSKSTDTDSSGSDQGDTSRPDPGSSGGGYVPGPGDGGGGEEPAAPQEGDDASSDSGSDSESRSSARADESGEQRDAGAPSMRERVEETFSEGAQGADAERVGEDAYRVSIDPTAGSGASPGPFAGGTRYVATSEVGVDSLESLATQQSAYADVAAAMNQFNIENEQIQLREEMERRAEEMQSDFERGALGDTQEIREETVADNVSEQVGVPLSDEDFSLQETDDGEFRVNLSDTAQRAAALSSSAEFLRRDAEIERTDDGFTVNLPGDTDATEEALTARIRGEEAFGGETKFDVPVFGTVNVDQATEDFAGGVESAASGAVDVADEVNLFSTGATGYNRDQSVTSAATASEASEDLLLQSIEGAATGAGEIPSDLLEVGEAATDPQAYQVGAELTMMGTRRLDDISVDSLEAAGQGTIETLERVDTAARQNPEAAATVGAGLLGGALLTGASYAAAPAALSRVGSVSPRAARAGEIALDPLRTSTQAGANVVRRIDLPDGDSLRLTEFRQDTRGMARLTGRQRTDADTSGTGDVDGDTDDLGVPDDPFLVSDKRVYDEARTFDEANDPSVDIDPTDRSGVAEDDIQGGIAGEGDPEAAPGTDFTWETDSGTDMDFEWEFDTGSRAAREDAETPNVGTGDTNIDGEVTTADADTVTDTDATVAGLLELTSENAMEDAFSSENIVEESLTGSGVDVTADSDSDVDVDVSDALTDDTDSGADEGVDVVVDPDPASQAGNAESEGATDADAAGNDAESVLDVSSDGVFESTSVTESVTAMDTTTEIVTEREFRGTGRGSPNLPDLPNRPNMDTGTDIQVGTIGEKTFSYDVATPDEVAEGLDTDVDASVDAPDVDVNMDTDPDGVSLNLDI